MGRTVIRLVGVYDADGTVLGELSYFLRVAAVLDDGRCHMLLGPDDLAACAGSPEKLVERIRATMSDQGLGRTATPRAVG